MHTLNLKAFRCEIFSDQTAKLNIVVDDQDAFHSSSSFIVIGVQQQVDA
jgi:hypothetical protein